MAEEVKQANQYSPDPRQTLFLQYYLDPKSDTFSNALQSALKVGYTQEYAENITSIMPKWLSENIGRFGMLDKAEKNLLEFLEMETEKDPKLVSIKADISKFIASRLGKSHYSERQELSGSDGKPLEIQWKQ